MSDDIRDTRARARDAVPDVLLAPLLEAAADALRALDTEDVPASLRSLRGFDRRGLVHGPARRQLRRALEDDEEFCARVVERFRAQAAVGSVLEQWSPADARAAVEHAANRRELPLLASVLWACAPPAADFALGFVVAADTFEQREREQADRATAEHRELTALTEAVRRAEAARARAEADAERAAEELRRERAARRAREADAAAEAHTERRRAERLDAELRDAYAAAAAERARTAGGAQRARTLEEQLRRARAQVEELSETVSQSMSRLNTSDARVLADAITTAQRLAAELASMRTRIDRSRPPLSPSSSPSSSAEESASGRDRPLTRRPLTRRVVPVVPRGIIATSAAGMEAMLRSAGVHLVIDGYNITKRAWPEATAAEQRQRLVAAVTRLHHRFGCAVLCVFDGDGGRLHTVVRPGAARVVFSDADEEADEVVVREVADLPKRIPVVVASSDAWVREHAEAAGAVVVPADALVDLIRAAR